MVKKIIEKIKKSRVKKSARKTLVAKLDSVFSEYIRERDGYKCFTCGLVGYRGDGIMQCGHLLTRGYYNTRWLELNAHAQCRGCNLRHEFDYEVYRKKFVDKYGEKEYDDMYRLAKSYHKFLDEDLEKMIEDFKEKIRVIKNGNI